MRETVAPDWKTGTKRDHTETTNCTKTESKKKNVMRLQFTHTRTHE